MNDCPTCKGKGWIRIREEATPREPAEVLCPRCAPPDDDEDLPVGHDPEDEDAEQLTLAQWIDVQVDRYRGLDHDAGDLVADRLADLAREVRATRAATAIEFIDRLEVLNIPDED